jgi:hypothetical protein
MLIDLLSQAAAHAVVVVAGVEALRKRLEFDGWVVLLVAALFALAIAALFLPVTTTAGAVEALRVASLSWLIAVGGDAWVAKLAARNDGK